MECDQQLLTGLRQGNSVAFEQLVERFEGPLYRFFLSSHGDPQLAGEQSVDCFSDLFRALPKMAGGTEQLRPFVFTVARNVLRRHWRQRPQESISTEAANEVLSKVATPAKTAEAREEVTLLLAAIQTLDPATREVFVLRFIEQLSLAEVATVVGEPLGTVKSRVHRGRQRLKVLLRPNPTGIDSK